MNVYLCFLIYTATIHTVYSWTDVLILGDGESNRGQVGTRLIPKRSVLQSKSDTIFFPEDEQRSSTTLRQRPTVSSFALAGENMSSSPGPNSISPYPVASPSKLPGVKPLPDSLLEFPDSATANSSEEGMEESGNIMIGIQLSKFISWVKGKGVAKNYTEPSTNIDDIPIDNFNLGRVQSLKCPAGQVSNNGRCMNKAEFK